MALNERLAAAICVVVTVGTPCALHRFAPQVEVPSPLGVGVTRDGPGAAEAAPRAEVDGRTAWIRRFQRPNALDTQAEANRTTKDALALLPPNEPLFGDGAPVALPPLVYQETVVADGSEMEPELLPAVDNQAVVVDAGPGGGDAADGATPNAARRYCVARGDTLTKIARREWNSDDRRLVALLLETNPKVCARKNRILVGEELTIPDTAVAQRVLGGAAPSTGAVLADAAPAKAEVDAAVGASKTGDRRWYTIQRKDTLASIARRFLKDGRRWREIVVLNRTLDPHKIVPGTRIKLPPVMRLAQG